MAENKKELHDEELDKASGGLTVNTKLKNEYPSPNKILFTEPETTTTDESPQQNLIDSLDDNKMINNGVPKDKHGIL